MLLINNLIPVDPAKNVEWKSLWQKQQSLRFMPWDLLDLIPVSNCPHDHLGTPHLTKGLSN